MVTQRLPGDEPGDGAADERQGDDRDPGGFGQSPALRGRRQDGVRQAVEPEAHHEQGKQGTGQQHGRSLTSAVYAMGGITSTSAPDLSYRPLRSSDDVAGELVIRWPSGNRAGERFMRLRLFDRIRRLAQSRRPRAEATLGASGVQGRHRRDRRRGPAPSGPPAELAHTATPWPGGSPAPPAPFSPGGAPARPV